MRMLCSAECCWAARSSRSPRGHQRCGRTKGNFSRDNCGEAGELRSGRFSPQRDTTKRADAQPGLQSPRAKPAPAAAVASGCFRKML